jgi:hypothetical protein
LKSGYRSNKLVRVRGGCLGTKSLRKTRLPAISVGELEANDKTRRFLNGATRSR